MLRVNAQKAPAVISAMFCPHVAISGSCAVMEMTLVVGWEKIVVLLWWQRRETCLENASVLMACARSWVPVACCDKIIYLVDKRGLNSNAVLTIMNV